MAHRTATGRNHNLTSPDLNPTAERPGAATSAGPRGSLIQAACTVIAVAAIISIPLLVGKVDAETPSPEGFSSSAEGLSEALSDAWHATVLVESRGLVFPIGKPPRHRTRRGSGIVMGLEFERRLAVIATNAHIITCRGTTCNVRVGIGNPSSEDGLVWSEVVRIVSWVPEKDLAFLEAEIPDDARLRVARFASAECGMTFADRVVSIGWPDLRVRRSWGVAPPPNFTDQVKRHSDGSLLLCLGNYQLRGEDNRLMEPMEVVFHNADVLPGSSGGPVVNRDGNVLGLNTIVLRNDRETERHRFCARRNVNETGQCMHAAIASIELITEYERIYSSQIKLAGCLSPSELDVGM